MDNKHKWIIKPDNDLRDKRMPNIDGRQEH